eukprot:g1542.t1
MPSLAPTARVAVELGISQRLRHIPAVIGIDGDVLQKARERGRVEGIFERRFAHTHVGLRLRVAALPTIGATTACKEAVAASSRLVAAGAKVDVALTLVVVCAQGEAAAAGVQAGDQLVLVGRADVESLGSACMTDRHHRSRNSDGIDLPYLPVENEGAGYVTPPGGKMLLRAANALLRVASRPVSVTFRRPTLAELATSEAGSRCGSSVTVEVQKAEHDKREDCNVYPVCVAILAVAPAPAWGANVVENWVVHRRFRAFDELRALLSNLEERAGGDAARLMLPMEEGGTGLPKFPSKLQVGSWLGGSNEERQRGLQEWLGAALRARHTMCGDARLALDDFLGMEAHTRHRRPRRRRPHGAIPHGRQDNSGPNTTSSGDKKSVNVGVLHVQGSSTGGNVDAAEKLIPTVMETASKAHSQAPIRPLPAAVVIALSESEAVPPAHIALLHALYAQYNPGRLISEASQGGEQDPHGVLFIARLLKKFCGQEHQLFERLDQRYGKGCTARLRQCFSRRAGPTLAQFNGSNDREECRAGTVREQLIAFYEKYNPAKLEDNEGLERILKQYAGREEQLFCLLRDKYCSLQSKEKTAKIVNVTEPESETNFDDAMLDKTFVEQLRSFYRLHQPAYANDNVDKLAAKFAGREQELLQRIRAKYGVAPEWTPKVSLTATPETRDEVMIDAVPGVVEGETVAELQAKAKVDAEDGSTSEDAEDGSTSEKSENFYVQRKANSQGEADVQSESEAKADTNADTMDFVISNDECNCDRTGAASESNAGVGARTEEQIAPLSTPIMDTRGSEPLPSAAPEMATSTATLSARAQPSSSVDVTIVAGSEVFSQLQRLPSPSTAVDALCESHSSTPDVLLATVRALDADDEQNMTDNHQTLGAFLASLGLGRYAAVFAAEAIDGETLLMLGADAGEGSNNGGSSADEASLMCHELLPAASNMAFQCLRRRHECKQLGEISSNDNERWAPASFQTRSADKLTNEKQKCSQIAIAQQLASADLLWLAEVLRILLQRGSAASKNKVEKITCLGSGTTSTNASVTQEPNILPVNDSVDDHVDTETDCADTVSDAPQANCKEDGFAGLLAAARSSVEEEAQRVLAEAAPAGNMNANDTDNFVVVPQNEATALHISTRAITATIDGDGADDASDDLFCRREAAKWADEVAEKERERRIAEMTAQNEAIKCAEELERSKRKVIAHNAMERERQRRVQAQREDALEAQNEEAERRSAARIAANNSAAQELQRCKEEWHSLCAQQAAEWKKAREQRDEARRRICHLQQVETAQHLALQAHLEAKARLQRSEAQAEALVAMDAEQARRIELAVEAASAQAKVRESARTTALMAAEAERERRIAEWHAIAADEANTRAAGRVAAMQAAEGERQRLLAMALTEAQASAEERAAEGLRARALEHDERERRVGAAASAAARNALEREANR